MLILGIAHDLVISSASLIENGKVIFAISEERLNRIKHYKGFPKLAIKACLKFKKINLDDLDYIAVGWNPLNTMHYPDNKISNLARHRGEYLYSIPNQLIQFKKNNDSNYFTQSFDNSKSKIIYFNHQDCHAAHAFFHSGFSKSSIITVDGRGEFETGYFGIGNNNKISKISNLIFPNSLGLFYASITQFLGFKAESDEWKVMALCAYTSKKNNKYINLFNQLYSNNSNLNGFELNNKFFSFAYPDVHKGNFFNSNLIKLLGQPRKSKERLSKKHYQIAYALQYHFEKIMTNFILKLKNKTKSKNLVFAGGCAMNCKFNGIIKKKCKLNNVYIPSAPDDSGISVGAGILAYSKFSKLNNKKNINKQVLENYWGTEYLNKEIKKILDNNKIKYKISNNICKEVAKLISKNNLVGWFQGRSEFGQRALGNRSILADPRNINIKSKINLAIKFRENFRPFAPAIIKHYFDDYFYTDGEKDIPFMEKTKFFKKNVLKIVPGVVHNDSTGRVQTVDKTNLLFFNLINNFYKLTDVPILLNTSFNLNGEPIVESPSDALKTFYSCGLDYLIINNFVINK